MIGRLIKMILSLLFIAGIGFACFTIYENFKIAKTTKRNISTVTKNDVIQRISFSGRTLPLKSSSINPPFEGYVKKLFVKVGSTVKKNDPLISVAENLNIDTQDVFPIRAPFSGTVVQVTVSEGQNVSKDKNYDGSNLMLRVDDMSQMFVQAEVPEVEYVHIKAGQNATIKAPALIEKTYNGIVIDKSLASASQERWNRNSVVFPTKIEVKDADTNLKPGMSVLIDIIVAERKNVLTLKHEFIENENGKYFAKKEDGSRVPIQIGIQDDVYVEIQEGLSLGDKIEQVDFLKSSEN